MSFFERQPAELLGLPDGQFIHPAEVTFVAAINAGGRGGWRCAIDLGAGEYRRAMSVPCRDESHAAAVRDMVVGAQRSAMRPPAKPA